MPYPVDAGAAGNFDANGTIPEVWGSKLLVKFYEATVFGEIANTDYEGEIKNQGDTVHIIGTPDITITDHEKGQQLTHQQPEPPVVDLLIDKGKKWSFIAERVDQKQAGYNFISDWTADASSQMKITIDSDILTGVYADGSTDNKGATAGKDSNFGFGITGTPASITKATVLDFIADAGTILAGDGTSIMRNGRIGMIDRFTIYRSNQLHVGGAADTHMMFGHKSAITFASQLVENEGPMKHPDYFGDYYRGLQVFGYKVVKPEALGLLVGTPA